MANGPLFVPRAFGGYSARFAKRAGPIAGTTGVLTVSWDLRPMIKMATRIAGEAHSADGAIKQAHTQMARTVQEYAAQALKDQIAHRGPRNIGPREQRGSRLVDAIEADYARRVDLTGFTVGYLDDSPAKLYWRRIEEGSDSQIGQVFYGAFLSADGKWSWPTGNEGAQVDPKLYKFRAIGPLNEGGTFTSRKQRALEGEENTGGRTPVVHIGRGIPAYHYLARGFQKWLGVEGGFGSFTGGAGHAGLARNTIVSTYSDAFAAAGLTEFTKWWFHRFGVAPTGRNPVKQYGSLFPGEG